MSEHPEEPAGLEPAPADAPTDQQESPPAAVEPPEIVTDPPPSEPVGPSGASVMPTERAVVPDPPKGLQTKRYTGRILLIYGLLLAAFAGTIAGVVLATTGGGGGGGGGGAKGWSDWKPDSGTTAAMAKQIADHVGHRYKLNKKGQQLVAIISEPPLVTSGTHKVSISNIAIRTTPNGKVINVVPSSHMWADEYCGLGPQCAIASGQPSETRGRLVRREALEVALYTFKYIPSVESVIAFMPPPAGQSQQELLFLQKQNLQAQLDQPLSKTLPLATPPLPTDPNVTERAMIDRLTLPALYKYHLQQLQDASVLLVLDKVPIPS